ncbi:DUF4230 domain-containing protein [Cecembia lonarensis]|uniref:DUF4230 domain-containing protein n=1 Tax=Cecembia lonarensis (strain CCUG 58316 / KCTC 22772 / LW9) TaxID=1225176 RepID=K1LB07_CECL9|nr:DUF4230 domain-containing protein [Cecembia lonarensis]EKB49447.1 hypothetical protein B879_01933 [Cecembia lonarensis LW9]
MNKFIIGFIFGAFLFIAAWFVLTKKESKEELRESSALIQQQIEQVGKLIVTEGYFSQVFTFKNSQNLFLNMLRSDKKALVVANAKVTVEYDLRQLETELDIENKTVILKRIPEPVVNIYPDIEYYDVTQDYFNKFGAADYNKIKNTVNARIREKVNQSNLMDNSRERLMAELANILVLTKSLGWTLKYEEVIIESEEQMKYLER